MTPPGRDAPRRTGATKAGPAPAGTAPLVRRSNAHEKLILESSCSSSMLVGDSGRQQHGRDGRLRVELQSQCVASRRRSADNLFLFAADGSAARPPFPRSETAKPVTLARAVRPWLPKATVAVEDRRFYQHGGVDYASGSGGRLVARRQRRQGRPGRLDDHPAARPEPLRRQERTQLGRKLKEACLAIKLSDRWSRDRILQEYLNTVYYGNHAYGAEAAAADVFLQAHARAEPLAPPGGAARGPAAGAVGLRPPAQSDPPRSRVATRCCARCS